MYFNHNYCLVPFHLPSGPVLSSQTHLCFISHLLNLDSVLYSGSIVWGLSVIYVVISSSIHFPAEFPVEFSVTYYSLHFMYATFEIF